ncbi:MAG: beta-propeller fold lactonase family protein [Acidobacteriia bacterium]|nr:beta-propeller fold lactonase family protein [Terriglobia bacterium]
MCATFACLVLSLAACGGAGKQAVTTPPANTHFPTALEIAPAVSLQSVGATQQFKATATFNDATTRDVTGLSVWASNANSVATITQLSGLESAVGAGDVTISATFGMAGETVTASFLVHVTATPLQSIAVVPSGGILELGTNQQFGAIGTFADGTTHILTPLVAWSTTDPAVLQVNTTPQRIGQGYTRGPGDVRIVVKLNGVSGEATVSVVRRVPKFLYTAGLSGIEGFSIDSTSGRLTPATGSKFTAVGTILSLAVTRDQKFLYAADSVLGVVWGFQIGAAGELTPLPDGPFSTSVTSSPVSVVAHPTADFLFMTDANAREITTFSIGANGSLTALPPANLANTNLLSANTSPDGRFFYQALHVGAAASIPAFSIAADGTLSAVPGDPASTGFIPKALAVDPSGRFLYAVISSSSLGPSTSVFGYSIDPVNGALTQIGVAPFTAGENPTSAAVDASGRFLYVTNGANSAGGNSVTGFSIDEDIGALIELQGSPFPASISPVSVMVEPGAQFAYVGLDGTQGVRVFTIDQLTGALSEVRGSPSPTDVGALAMVATY